MIYYLIDFFINNSYFFKSLSILINIDNYSRVELVLILFIDIFINKIPIIFFGLLALRYFNKFLRKGLVSSLVVDNFIFIIDYIIFMTLIYFGKNSYISMKGFCLSLTSNFIFNYVLFWVFKRVKYNRINV